MNEYIVTFTSDSRTDPEKHHNAVMTVKAINQVAAEDIVMRKCRLIGYRNYQVEAVKVEE